MKNNKPVSPSEDKTAEQFYESHVNQVLIDGTRKRIIKAMTEYGTLCRNKAIEEAVKVADCHFPADKRLSRLYRIVISELNKLKA